MNYQEALEYLEELGMKAIRIRKLEPAKHIFSHKEWHMTGYAVRVDELAGLGMDKKEPFLFIDPAETKDKYPIPSAFAAYADYMEMKRGI